MDELAYRLQLCGVQQRGECPQAGAPVDAGSRRDFELVVIPGAHHTMGELYGEHKRYDFFVKNLLGVKPPKWSDVKSK